VDTLDDYNISQKNAPTGSVPPSMLVSNAIRNFADQMASPSVNSNNFRLYVQQWATTTYLDEPRYNLTARTIPQTWWQTYYRDVLADLREAKKLITADLLAVPAVRQNQLAQIAIFEAYTWSVLVNTFGDIPYSQALDYTNSLPVYDDAQTVFYDQLTKLDAAIAALTTTSGGIVTANDLLYAGSVTNWKKFGNSIKLKMAMVIADSDPAKSKLLAEQAAAAGLISANTENARVNGYTTSAPNNNPISANTISPFTTRQDFVVGRTIVNKVNNLADPRGTYWFTTVSGAFVGGNTGFSNTYATTSKPSSLVTVATAETVILDYAEVEFLLAEAVARGYTIPATAGVTGVPTSAGATAEAHYNAGIAASIAYWFGLGGVATTAAAATNAYLLNPDVAYTTASSYVTSNTPTNTQQGQVTKVSIAGNFRKVIGEQKYLALNNRGFDAWTEWRRLDAPTLIPVNSATLTTLIIPNRLIYPVSEQTQNGSAWAVAAAKYGGAADTTAPKLFWDKF